MVSYEHRKQGHSLLQLFKLRQGLSRHLQDKALYPCGCRGNRCRNGTERLTELLLEDEEHFAEILTRKSSKDYQNEKKLAESELEKAEIRIEMMPKLLKRLYEENLSRKTSDDDYNILFMEYSEEKVTLKKKIL